MFTNMSYRVSFPFKIEIQVLLGLDSWKPKAWASECLLAIQSAFCLGICFLERQKHRKDEFMKPIACITSLQHMRTLEQELKRDLDSHTFDHKNRKEKKNLSIHKQ